MRKNDLNEIKNANVDAISAKIAQAKKDVTSSIIDKNMNKLGDLKSIYKKKRDIAQLSTILNQKLEVERLEKNLEQMKGETK
jgi:ribosomal protein L29